MRAVSVRGVSGGRGRPIATRAARAGRRALQVARRELRPVVVLAVALILAVGALRVGALDFLCTGMDAAMPAPCCAHDTPDPATADAASLTADDGCCTPQRVRAPLPGARADVTPLAEPAPVAVLAAPTVVVDGIRAAPLLRPFSARDGPVPRAASEACALRMVFLS